MSTTPTPQPALDTRILLQAAAEAAEDKKGIDTRILEIMGYTKEQAESRFGFLFNALDAGAPPHGGFAFGYDRWTMLLAGAESLRDVIAFPKTQRGQDLLLDAPSRVEPEQLAELRLRVEEEPGA